MKNDERIKIINPSNDLNIYEKRNIIINNIKRIDKALNSKLSINLRSSTYWEIVKLKKSQNSELKKINIKIDQIEQVSFPFGG